MTQGPDGVSQLLRRARGAGGRDASVNDELGTLIDGQEPARLSKRGPSGDVAKIGGDNATNRGAQNGRKQTPSAIPQRLRVERTQDSDRLEQVIDRQLKRDGQPTGFKALAIGQDQLSDALRGALATIERATGTRVVIFRNLTPEIADFNGATVRDGLYLKPNRGDDPSMPSCVKSVSTAETLTPLQSSSPAKTARPPRPRFGRRCRRPPTS